MKSTTTLLEQERLAPAQRIAWLVSIDDGTNYWYASNRAITVGIDVYEPLLTDLPSWSLAPSRSGTLAGGLVSSKAEVRLLDAFSTGPPLAESLATRDPFEFRFILKILWMDPQDAWTSSDRLRLLSGRVESWAEDKGVIVLHAADSISAKSRKRVGRRLSEEMLSGASSPLVGSNLPIVFGVHDDFVLRPLYAGVTTNLSDPVDTTDGVLAVASLEGFPSSGTAQIGTEQITYAAVDSLKLTLGTPDIPATRAAAPLRHTKREPVRFVPTGGFKWIVADHACDSVTNLRANGVTLDGADWTAQLETIGTISTQIVQMDAWPTLLRYSNATRERSGKTLTSVGSNLYTVGSGNTALTPELAVDSSSSSVAMLKTANPKLSLDIGNELATEGKLAGLWYKATLRVRYSSDIAWNAGSTVKVRLDQDGAITEATLPVGSPSTTIQEFELDISGAIGASTGWDGFDVTPLVVMEVEFTPDGSDTAQISIHDLDVRVTYFPGVSAQMAGPVTARVEGWMENGLVITNPTDILKTLLTDDRFGESSSNIIVALNLAVLNFDLTTEGYGFAKIIDNGPSLSALVDDAAREAALWVWSSGTSIAVRRRKIWPRLDTATALDASVRISRKSEGKPNVETERESGPCIDLLAPASEETAGEVSVLMCRNSSDAAEAIPTRLRLDWLDGRDPRPLNVLARLLRNEKLTTRLVHRGVYPPGLAILEPGDEVLVTDTIAGVKIAAPMWVRSLELSSKGELTIEADGLRPGARPFASGETTFLRVFDAGEFLALYIEGEPVAVLERLGHLDIAGQLTEAGSLGAGPFSSAVAYSGGSIFFSVYNGATYDPFFELDANGNVTLLGDLVEASNLNFATPGEYVDADNAGFRISPHPDRADFEYADSTAALHLRGELVEEQSF